MREPSPGARLATVKNPTISAYHSSASHAATVSSFEQPVAVATTEVAVIQPLPPQQNYVVTTGAYPLGQPQATTRRAQLAEDEIGENDFRESPVAVESSLERQPARSLNAAGTTVVVAPPPVAESGSSAVYSPDELLSLRSDTLVVTGHPQPTSGGINASLDNPSVHNVFVAAECPVQSVTVYQDKAEICRYVRPRVVASEITEVLFKKLSPYIDKESIKVEVNGRATIQDVTYTVRPTDDEEADYLRNREDLLAKLRQSRRHFDALLVKRSRLEKQRSVLNTFADSLVEGGGSTGVDMTTDHSLVKHEAGLGSPASKDDRSLNSTQASVVAAKVSTDRYDPRNMETIRGFFTLYEDRADKLDETLLSIREELEDTDLSIREAEKSLKSLDLRHEENLTREIKVLLEATESGPLLVYLTYVVGNVCWTPAYDMRIFNNNGNLKIIYYGMVQQGTGEDWATPRLYLSTSQPGIAGIVPELGVQKLQFKSTKSLPPTAVVLPTGKQDKPPRSKSFSRKDKDKLSTTSKEKTPSTSRADEPVLAVNNEVHHHHHHPYTSGGYRDSVYLGGGSSTLQRSHVETHQSSPRSTLSAPVNAGAKPTIFACGEGGHYVLDGTLGRGRMATPSLQDECDYAETCATLMRPSNMVGGHQQSTMESTASTYRVPVQANDIVTAGIQFEVQRPPTCIPSDLLPHRVTIGIIDLQPIFEYSAIPKKSPNAFVKASMVNNSKFPLLAGPTSIYTDNIFVGKSSIGTVLPCEEFSSKLGPDLGIKINYHPMYKQKTALNSSSSKVNIFTYRVTMDIKNTHDRAIKLLVLDQLPLSAEEKLKITLHEPIIKHPDKYDRSKPIRINKSNNLEWDLDLQPGESKELTVKYSVELPITEESILLET